MSENEEKKNTAAELTDEQVDRVAGGSGDDLFPEDYCPYCNKMHVLRRLGDITMRPGMIAEAYECTEKRRLFCKVGKSYYNEIGLPIH